LLSAMSFPPSVAAGVGSVLRWDKVEVMFSPLPL
jgi:hypothetical protein